MRKLLVADDSTTIQRVVELTFAGEDIQVVAVGDGDQAIARIPIEQPDIVLADIAMPKRDGYAVSKFVKGHRDLAHVPVLLLAGAFEPVDDARARDSRSDGVIVKPFDPRQVVTRVRELLDAPRPALAEPDSATVAEQRSRDDFFDRLDHALQARVATSPAAVAPVVPDDAGGTTAAADVPTVESVLDARPVDVQTPSRRDEDVLSDDLVDAVTNRVLERLSRGAFKDMISTVVREVVEERTRNERL